MRFSRRSLLIGTAALLVTAPLRANEQDMLTIEGPAFGAGWRVRIGAQADGNAVAAAVMEVVRSVDDTMSPFRAETEISRLNAAQTRDWLPVSPNVMPTLHEARRVHDLTLGAFDPTLGGVSGRYGFSPIRQAPAGRFAGVTLGAGRLRKDAPGQSFDLCGIAKGRALDRVVAAIAGLGHRDFFVEMGGEVMARGRHPAGRDWSVGVEHPTAQIGALWHRVALNGEALATSGDRVNSYLSGAHRYGHIIDPRSQRPADTPLASVSVFAPTAMTADALATALFALGPEAGPELAQRADLAALFLIRDGDHLRAVTTADYATRIVT